MSQPNVNAPLFTSKDLSATAQAAVAQRGTPATLNLDDIFGDVVFTPDGDTVFKSEMEGKVQQISSKMADVYANRCNSTLSNCETKSYNYCDGTAGEWANY